MHDGFTIESVFGEDAAWLTDDRDAAYGYVTVVVKVPDDVAAERRVQIADVEGDPDDGPRAQREYIFPFNVINKYPRRILKDW